MSLSAYGCNVASEVATEPIQTESGLVCGVPGRITAITVFRGIPYAAPPVGDLRWRPPRRPSPWRGVRIADEFGCICPQVLSDPSSASLAEDCLSLNVWTGARSGEERRPVLVWIHGGHFAGGAGSDPVYDGEGLALKGLVVVTMNYRTGVFGFLATPELSKESGHYASGNYGLLDQIACLQWVRRNIAAFGGDPDRVTIAGQASGAASVLLLSQSKLAKGLFHRAIAESGIRYLKDPELRSSAECWRSMKEAEDIGARFLEEQGVRTMKDLRAVRWQKLLESNDGVLPHVSFRPVVDGWVVPHNVGQAFSRDAPNDVPFLTGCNRDECCIESQPEARLDEFEEEAKRRYGEMADEFFSLYPAASDLEAAQAMNTVIRDTARVSTFLWALDWRRAKKSSVYTYFWTHTPPGPDQKRKGASSGAEISYVLGNLHARERPWTTTDRKIADTVSSYWVNFAAAGNPNGKGLPKWPAVDPEAPNVMELGDRFAPIPVADSTRLDFIRRYFLTQKSW